MKDNEKRELVDELVGIARVFHASGQLRDRIRNAVLPALERLERHWAHEGGKAVAQVAINLQPREIDWGDVDEQLLSILKRHAEQPIRKLDPLVSDLRVLLRRVGDPL